jgi:5'-3' exonuclease
MGVEKFFNTLVSSYKSKLITTFNTTTADILFFDFNSIIHKISMQTVSDLNYLYKILLIALNYPSPKLISFFENKYKTYKDIFYLSIDFIHTPSGILQLINDLTNLDPNIIIIHQIIKSIEMYISNFSDLQFVYLSLDGVPTISKIMEQRHRRYIGEIINYQIIKKISNYKLPDKLSEEYPYDYVKYNKTKFSFLKLNISPGTTFMKQLVKSIKSHTFPVNVQINDDTISGEGEYKIINFIRTYQNLFLNKKITVYSPDSDMILLCSILPNDINIIRYDQQNNQDYVLSTEIFKLLITEYITGEKNTIKQEIINDIIFIFTIFGDDFLPRLEAIQVSNHYEKVMDIYKKIYKNNYIIYSENDEYKINLVVLKQFFTELKEIELPNLLQMFNLKNKNNLNLNLSNIKTIDYTRKKNSSFNNDPLDNNIINTLNKDIHNSNYLEEKYSVKFYLYPKNTFYNKYSIDKENSVKEYINGLSWIFNYYFNNKLNYSWYYPYSKAPFIEDISDYLDKLTTIPLIEESYPLLLSPIEQSIYTSPIEITSLLSKKYQNMTKVFYKKYNLTNILGKIDSIQCNNSNYLSKCSLMHINHPIYKLTPIEFIKEFRTDSTSKEFINLVKYYEITNDPFFYDILKKKLNT